MVPNDVSDKAWICKECGHAFIPNSRYNCHKCNSTNTIPQYLKYGKTREKTQYTSSNITLKFTNPYYKTHEQKIRNGIKNIEGQIYEYINDFENKKLDNEKINIKVTLDINETFYTQITHQEISIHDKKTDNQIATITIKKPSRDYHVKINLNNHTKKKHTIREIKQQQAQDDLGVNILAMVGILVLAALNFNPVAIFFIGIPFIIIVLGINYELYRKHKKQDEQTLEEN